ncbi:MAG: class A beta-lactamase-related serine hydrolase, partial [Candidatus Roizmanbacteria bacterium]|nr:class A beta-lactamase-related serine hydrolase [Candidatus Roizmanbacteria bacterium]
MPRQRKISYNYKTSESIEKKSIKPVVYFLLLIFTIFAVLNMRNSVTKATNVLPFKTVSTEPQTLSELSLSIRNKIAEEEGTYSIRFEDFESKNAFGINDEPVVTAASVIKIPVLAALYYLAEKDEIDLDEVITIPESDMQRWGTGVIRYQDAGATYTNRELGQVMMEHSDNTAVYVLANRVIGLDRLQELIDSWGLDNTHYLDNEVSNKDMNKIMRMMFLGEIVTDEQLVDEMMGRMDDSDFEERLPKYIPEEVPVYHKIGNEVRITHDVGVFDLENKPYYLGILGIEVPD